MKPISCFFQIGAFLCVAVVASAQPDEVSQKVAEADNAFGFKLLAQTQKAHPGKNIFVSPPGLAFVLAMAANGARGETLRQMKSILEWNEPPDLNTANHSLLDHLLKLDPQIKLEVANSLWTDRQAKINPAFISSSEREYEAKVASVDFQNPATADRINQWVDARTHGKIEKMVRAPFDPATRLILLNAIYFKGDWSRPFNKKLTRSLPFKLANRETISQPLMSQSGDFEYQEDKAFQAVKLDYARWGATLYVFLPRQNLHVFLQHASLENWETWIEQFHSQNGTVKLPRFKLKNEYDLKNVLIDMGMRTAFEPDADFGGISPEQLSITEIRQKTFVEVNEKGTEAAAATEMTAQEAGPQIYVPPFEMVVDRPFLMALRDNKTGTILFLGAIWDPR